VANIRSDERAVRRKLPARSAALGIAILAASLLIGGVVWAGVWDRPNMEPYRLPVNRNLLSRRLITRPHHDHPAWDFFTPSGTLVYAAQGGRVVATLHSGACGTGVVIDGFDGYRYTYCHGSKTLVSGGSRVHSGDPVMRSGSSGSATTAHLHFEVENASLRLKCPQPMLLSWWQGGQMTPASAPWSGCTS
jgi:hypothetical protein